MADAILTKSPAVGLQTCGRAFRPLTEHAIDWLKAMRSGPVVSQYVNPGVRRRLDGEGLVREVQAKSPFIKDNGGTCAHLELTDAGRAKLAEIERG